MSTLVRVAVGSSVWASVVRFERLFQVLSGFSVRVGPPIRLWNTHAGLGLLFGVSLRGIGPWTGRLVGFHHEIRRGGLRMDVLGRIHGRRP